MKKLIYCFMAFALLFTLIACNTETSNIPEDETETLLVYCGAGLMKPMTEIAEKFETDYNIKITYSFAGSSQLLSQIELSKKGDIFMVGSTDAYDMAYEKKLVFEGRSVYYHVPVIGMPKNNPADIKHLEDLVKAGVKVILGDETANAIGIASQKIIKKSNLQGINDNVIAKTATLNELIIHLSLGDADAAIITLDMAVNNDDIAYIEIPLEFNSVETIPIGTLKDSKNIDIANIFVDFVSSNEGKAIFGKYGFLPFED